MRLADARWTSELLFYGYIEDVCHTCKSNAHTCETKLRASKAVHVPLMTGSMKCNKNASPHLKDTAREGDKKVLSRVKKEKKRANR
jgi:hypothetical protein